MANVNLYGAPEQAKAQSRARRSSLGSIVFSVAIIVITLGVFGGMHMWQGMVRSEVDATEATIATTRQSLLVNSEDIDALHDVDLRLTHIESAQAREVAPLLASIESDVISGVLLSSYSYEKEDNSISLEGDAVDFSTLARQVERFRGDSTIGAVVLESTGLSEEGYVLFTVRVSPA